MDGDRVRMDFPVSSRKMQVFLIKDYAFTVKVLNMIIAQLM